MKIFRSVLVAVAAMFFALYASADAQQPKKVARIGFLLAGDLSRQSGPPDVIRLALRELGYVEGENLVITYRYAEGKRERYPALATEVVRLPVDIIVVTGGTELVRAAKNATKTIPIVMVGAGGDPVGAGLVESLGRPGGNVTGITNLAGELGGKRLELFKEAVPKIVRVAVLYDSAAPGGVLDVKEILPGAARALRLTIRSWDVRTTEALESALGAVNKERLDGVYVASSPLVSANEKRIADFILKSRLPSIYVRKSFVEFGGLMSYGADQEASHRRVAVYVDKILKGAKPADLPVEQPTKFELAINLKTAKQIGVTIPQSVLYKADKVIK